MSPQKLQDEVSRYIDTQQNRMVLSARFPLMKPLIIRLHRILKKIKNKTVYIAREKSTPLLPYITARHSSPLLRKLGESDMRLQLQKITNLKTALYSLNNLLIKPGQTFSFWETLGKPTKSSGYVDGMLLSNGQIFEGIGGGLCQLGNLLHFLMLHTPLTVIERYHHSMDVFPDSARTIPFASGATVMYNFVDLQIKNTTTSTFQIKLWITDTQLKGQILSDQKCMEKIHVYQKDHIFIHFKGRWYRRNQLWRDVSIDGKLQRSEHLYTTIAPVCYTVTKKYLEKLGYEYVVL